MRIAQDETSIRMVCEALLQEKTVIIPTDTVYGFSGIVPQTDAHIRSIKGRGETKPFIQLIAEPQHIFLYTDIIIPSAIFSHMPGSLTVIVPIKASAGLTEKTIAFRCPSDIWLHSILQNVYEKTGRGIYSTSANRSGSAPLYNIDDITHEFENEVALIVDAGNYPASAIPSTIVSVSQDGSYHIIRQGGVILPAHT